MYYHARTNLPIIIAGIFLAFITWIFLGRSHLLSSLFGEKYITTFADALLFVLVVLYSLLLRWLRQYFSAYIFNMILWIFSAISMAFLLFSL